MTRNGTSKRSTGAAIQKKAASAYKLPSAKSEGEEMLAQHLDIYGIKYEREAQLIAGRKYRVDFYLGLAGKDIAVEVEGGTAFGLSRHSRGAGFERDARKYNALALIGVKVLRFTTAMVVSGEAIDTIRALFSA